MCPLPLPNGSGLSHDGVTGAKAPTAPPPMTCATIPVSRYQVSTDFIDQLCDRYLDGYRLSPESCSMVWDHIYDACRVDGPRQAVREARWWADYFDQD